MIYIDEVIVLNFIIDYLLLLFTSMLLKLNVRKYKLIISSIFGEISILYLFFDMNYILLIIFKICICEVKKVKRESFIRKRGSDYANKIGIRWREN